mgnify:CR=1 FL=1
MKFDDLISRIFKLTSDTSRGNENLSAIRSTLSNPHILCCLRYRWDNNKLLHRFADDILDNLQARITSDQESQLPESDKHFIRTSLQQFAMYNDTKHVLLQDSAISSQCVIRSDAMMQVIYHMCEEPCICQAFRAGISYASTAYTKHKCIVILPKG